MSEGAYLAGLAGAVLVFSAVSWVAFLANFWLGALAGAAAFLTALVWTILLRR